MSIFLNDSYIVITSIQVLFIYILVHLINIANRYNRRMEERCPKSNNFEIEEMTEVYEEHIDVDIDNVNNNNEGVDNSNNNDNYDDNDGDDNSIKTTSSTSSSVRSTSIAWDHFDRINENGQMWGKCKHCL